MTTKTDFHEFARHDRYRAFEILLWWEGTCNASDLSARFNVRRENVTKDIKAYRLNHGEQVVYDSLAKTYKPLPGFTPRYTSGQIREYMEFVRRFSADALPQATSAPGWLDSGPRPHIEPDPHLFRLLIQAIRYHRPMDIRYRSWNHPHGMERRIHPHALAHSGLRWHCRAYDERTCSYRDFHLGRFDSYNIVEDEHSHLGEDDSEWHSMIELELVPNPELTEGEKLLVKADYGLSSGVLKVTCRRSMAHYTLQNYQVDPDLNAHNQLTPKKNPLVLRNLSSVLTALFGRQ
ncbi:helix-turn-helix transcriptional regulator [Halomonas sp. AOP7-E1-9]